METLVPVLTKTGTKVVLSERVKVLGGNLNIVSTGFIKEPLPNPSLLVYVIFRNLNYRNFGHKPKIISGNRK